MKLNNSQYKPLLSDWIKQLDQSTIILTPHQQLAQYLQRIHIDQMAESVIETRSILSINTWLTQLWSKIVLHSSQSLPVLLTKPHSFFIWNDIISQHLSGDFLLSISDLARAAQNALSLLNQWGEGSYYPNDSELSLDQQQFQQWLKSYQAKLQQHHLIDEEQLLTWLNKNSAELKITLPADTKLILYGFQDSQLRSPLLDQFINLLKTTCQVIEQTALPLATVSKSVAEKEVMLMPKQVDELREMAYWAKQNLQASPTIQIGCLVPQLSLHQALVRKIFNEVFSLQEGTDAPFFIAALSPWHSIPIVQVIFKLFDIVLQPSYQAEAICFLLRSPFIHGAKQEFSKRALLEKKILEMNRYDWSWQQLYDLALESSCTQWIEILLQLQKFASMAQQGKRTYEQWARFFFDTLQAFGWPGEELGDYESQCIIDWHILLDQLTELDFLIPTFVNADQKQKELISFVDAVIALQQLAADKQCSVNSQFARINILNLTDAFGFSFDQLWVMGMDENILPAPAFPHPFLPIAWQVRHNIPHSSAEKEMAYAITFWQQLNELHPNLKLSYSQVQDGITLQPNSLLRNYSIKLINAAVSLVSTSDETLEYIYEQNVAEIALGQEIKGGAAILKHQAECPFKAFAIHRLQALPIELDLLEIDNKKRGIFIHAAMELLWRELKNLTNLNKMTLENLLILCDKVVARVLQQPAAAELAPALAMAEKKRLKKLLLEWIEVEKQREEFAVMAIEQSKEINLAGLPLRLRIDRIDELENGEQILIDYKTGQPKIQDWFGERPTEPQLPLYAVSMAEENVHGLAFAQLKVGNCAFKGVVATNKNLPGCRPFNKEKNDAEQWQQQLLDWQIELTKMVEDFRHGKAEVDPKEGAKTCQTCQLQSFCRVR